MDCKEGDKLKRGSVVFHDKNIPEICFVSPCSGTLAEIVRGEKRKIIRIIIEADNLDEAEKFDSIENPKTLFSKAGIYPFIIQRPYGIVANPNAEPSDIFISFTDTAPLANNIEFSLKDDLKYVKIAIDKLAEMTNGKVYLNFSKDSNIASEITENQKVEKNVFVGKHPAGLVGTQINKLRPINKGEVVWTINALNLPIIGKLFAHGEYQPEKTIAVAGSEVAEPQYYKMRVGADLSKLYDGMLTNDNVRIISGTVLSGTNISENPFLGFNDNQVCVIPEGNEYEMFGWMLPGADKCSNSRTFLSMLMPRKLFSINTNTHGEERAYVVTGQYEKVCPLDIYPQQLVKAAITDDIDKMEELGIYEVIEEDLALCEFVCTSKINVQQILRHGLDLVRKEME